MNKFFPIFLWACLANVPLYAQTLQATVINNMGGNMQGSNVKLTYSVGELAILTFTTSGFTLAQGFLQPEIQNEVTAIEPDFASYKLLAYPNPVQDKLQIETDLPNLSQVMLFDAQGRSYAQANYENAPLDFNHIPAGTYFMRLLNTQQRVMRTIKIVKL